MRPRERQHRPKVGGRASRPAAADDAVRPHAAGLTASVRRISDQDEQRSDVVNELPAGTRNGDIVRDKQGVSWRSAADAGRPRGVHQGGRG